MTSRKTRKSSEKRLAGILARWGGGIGVLATVVLPIHKGTFGTPEMRAFGKEFRAFAEKFDGEVYLGNLENTDDPALARIVRGEPQKALEYYKKALRMNEEVGHIKGQADQLNNIGVVYAGQGRLEEALGYFERARELFVRIGAKHMIEKTDHNIARAKASLERG